MGRGERRPRIRRHLCRLQRSLHRSAGQHDGRRQDHRAARRVCVGLRQGQQRRTTLPIRVGAPPRGPPPARRVLEWREQLLRRRPDGQRRQRHGEQRGYDPDVSDAHLGPGEPADRHSACSRSPREEQLEYGQCVPLLSLSLSLSLSLFLSLSLSLYLSLSLSLSLALSRPLSRSLSLLEEISSRRTTRIWTVRPPLPPSIPLTHLPARKVRLLPVETFPLHLRAPSSLPPSTFPPSERTYS
ncbi:hypothetical protein T484DRAFT_3418849 [Baffinella frigidus]|nr:hypothetical protein T484DRAFT_3418849 [Cryptophyta sp. CCMP2293]